MHQWWCRVGVVILALLSVPEVGAYTGRLFIEVNGVSHHFGKFSEGQATSTMNSTESSGVQQEQITNVQYPPPPAPPKGDSKEEGEAYQQQLEMYSMTVAMIGQAVASRNESVIRLEEDEKKNRGVDAAKAKVGDYFSEYNERNQGFGLVYQPQYGTQYSIGYYLNSLYKESYYATAMYYREKALYSGLRLRYGFKAGGVTGYRDSLMPLLVPSFSLGERSFGYSNLMYIPPIKGITPGVLAWNVTIPLQ